MVSINSLKYLAVLILFCLTSSLLSHTSLLWKAVRNELSYKRLGDSRIAASVILFRRKDLWKCAAIICRCLPPPFSESSWSRTLLLKNPTLICCDGYVDLRPVGFLFCLGQHLPNMSVSYSHLWQLFSDDSRLPGSRWHAADWVCDWRYIDSAVVVFHFTFLHVFQQVVDAGLERRIRFSDLHYHCPSVHQTPDIQIVEQ